MYPAATAGVRISPTTRADDSEGLYDTKKNLGTTRVLGFKRGIGGRVSYASRSSLIRRRICLVRKADLQECGDPTSLQGILTMVRAI